MPSLDLISSAIKSGEGGEGGRGGQLGAAETDLLAQACNLSYPGSWGEKKRAGGESQWQSSCPTCGFNTQCQEKHPTIDGSVLCTCTCLSTFLVVDKVANNNNNSNHNNKMRKCHNQCENIL